MFVAIETINNWLGKIHYISYIDLDKIILKLNYIIFYTLKTKKG